MIKAIIFDFGNVFLNLDIAEALENTLKVLEIEYISEDMITINHLYEEGNISTSDFLLFYQKKFPHVSKNKLIKLWNIMLKDFPKYRLDFLKELHQSSKYKLILLSNTNELHINWVKNQIPFYETFKSYFDAFYLSHEINLRKPNADIFEFVLSENQLHPEDCLFIDDNYDNICGAQNIGIKTWHIVPNKGDVTELLEAKKYLI